MLTHVDNLFCWFFETLLGEYRGFRVYQSLVRDFLLDKKFMLTIPAIILIKLFVININYIPSGSMNPAIVEGDVVLVNKLASHFRDPGYGDVITFTKDDTYTVKRIVGIPGDTVQIKGGMLYLNDSLTTLNIQEKLVSKNAFPAAQHIKHRSYLSQVGNSNPFCFVQFPLEDGRISVEKRKALYENGQFFFDSPRIIVPVGKLFVLGDNRLNSRDSRYSEFGFVPMDEVEGYVVSVLFNVKRIAGNVLKKFKSEDDTLPVRLATPLNCMPSDS